MISWKLWRALTNPPKHHPLFKYTLTHAKQEEPKVAPGFFMWIFMCSTLTLIFQFIFSWLPYLVLGAIVVLNSVYAFRWTVRISGTIVAEKEHSRYDLLATLPIGMLGTSWAISTGCLHRRASFRWLPYLMLMLAIMTTITMVIMSLLTTLVLTTALNTEAILANIDLLELSIFAVPFMFGFYFDHLYSILTATLIGIAATVDVRDSVDAQLRAGLGYVLIQVVVYVLLVFVLLVLMPNLFQFAGLTAVQFALLQGAIGLIFYIVMREWLIRKLWQFITWSFSAEDNEVKLVLKPDGI